MKKQFLYYIRYTIILLPVIGLSCIVTHTNPIQYSFHQKNTYHSAQYDPTLRPITPQKVTTLLDITGIKNTIQQIHYSHQWKAIYAQIQQGQEPWISLIPQLITQVPPKVKNHLNHSLIQAILANPQAVLNILSVNNKINGEPKDICSANNFSTRQKNYLLQKLYNLHSINIEYQKQSCLQALNSTARQQNLS